MARIRGDKHAFGWLALVHRWTHGTQPTKAAQLPYQVDEQKMNQTLDQLHSDLMKDTVAFPVLSAAELEECAVT
jgi:hypothetical protein